MKKPNICLVALTISPDKEDGEATVVRAYYDYLKKQGYNVKVITGLWNKKLNNPDIIQFKLITKRFLWIPHFLFKTYRYLKTHKFDIIQGNGPKGALPILLSGNKRFISSIHDLGPFEAKFSAIPLEMLLIKIIARRSTCITTVSNFSKKQFKHFIPKIDDKRIFNLYNGIDDHFKPQLDEAKKLRQKLNIRGPILLYIGRIASYKGVDDILKAYYQVKKTHKDLNLIIGGNPDFTMQKTYQEWKKVHKDVHFVGFIPTEHLPTYYTMGDIFITYSYAAEGFGLTPIEAISCGSPVIASSIPVYREVLQDNAILVPPKKPLLLAKEIQSLLDDDQKRKNLVGKAQKFIKRYTWNEVGKKLEQVYEKYLSL